MPVPESVTNPIARAHYQQANGLRAQIKEIAHECNMLRVRLRDIEAGGGEGIANATLAYRHLEDASMRLGKVLQAIDGGVSVYDRDTTVGAGSMPQEEKKVDPFPSPGCSCPACSRARAPIGG